ncbi:MAG: hypothetical protein ACOCZ8_01110 [Bacteroidota bacterium]
MDTSIGGFFCGFLAGVGRRVDCQQQMRNPATLSVITLTKIVRDCYLWRFKGKLSTQQRCAKVTLKTHT